MKVIVAAFACQPHRGSEPGVGWNWSLQVAKYGHEVHVITRKNNRVAIESELKLKPIANLHFHYLDLPQYWCNLREKYGNYSLLSYYYFWQVALFFKAKKLHHKIDFDLAHHVTYVNDWMPSGLCLLGIPFIWGPVGGSTHIIPEQIELELPTYAQKFESRRLLMQSFFKSFDPFLRLTRQRATKILTYTKEGLPGIPQKYQYKTTSIIHIGVSESDLPPQYQRVKQNSLEGELKIFTGGRLVHWKGFDLLIAGFGKYIKETGNNSKLIITGEGAYQSQLEQIAQSLGVEKQVDFVGYLPTRDDLFMTMQNCDLYALPTLRDGPPVAILEAMFAGMPIVCLDVGATHELVPEKAGLKIAVNNREQVIADLAAAFVWANNHREKLSKMGEEARKHTLKIHDWNRIGNEIKAVYEEVIATDNTSVSKTKVSVKT